MQQTQAIGSGWVGLLLKIAALVFIGGIAYGKYEDMSRQEQSILTHVDRIEKYLSSQDSDYWQVVGDLQQKDKERKERDQ